jgi:hypothetical protein
VEEDADQLAHPTFPDGDEGGAPFFGGAVAVVEDEVIAMLFGEVLDAALKGRVERIGDVRDDDGDTTWPIIDFSRPIRSSLTEFTFLPMYTASKPVRNQDKN